MQSIALDVDGKDLAGLGLGEQRWWYVDLELEEASVVDDEAVAHLDEGPRAIVRSMGRVLVPLDGLFAHARDREGDPDGVSEVAEE